MNIQETFRKALENQYTRHSILLAMEEEEKGVPLITPPAGKPGSWEYLVFGCEEILHPDNYFSPESYPESDLIGFAKMKGENQERVLIRASYIFARKYAFMRNKGFEIVS